MGETTRRDNPNEFQRIRAREVEDWHRFQYEESRRVKWQRVKVVMGVSLLMALAIGSMALLSWYLR